jgi:hypothetical protein
MDLAQWRPTDRWNCADLAIAPPPAEKFEVLDLYHATGGGAAALARKRRGKAIRAGGGRGNYVAKQTRKVLGSRDRD